MVVGKETADEAEEPEVMAPDMDAALRDRDGKGQEPDEPVKPEVVRRDLRRHAQRVAGLSFEAVLAPPGSGGDYAVSSTLQNDFIALAADAAEGAISIDQVPGVVTGVHGLVGRDEIERRLNAQGGGGCGDDPEDDGKGERDGGERPCGDRDRNGEDVVTECGGAENHGEPIEPGVIAAD